MKNKLILLALIGSMLAISGIGYKSVASIRKQQQLKELDNAQDRSSFSWYMRRAKIVGDKEVELPGLTACYGVPSDLQEAVHQFNIVSAVPTERYVTTNQFGILTWHKFKIVDDLSLEKLPDCNGCTDPPPESDFIPAALLPLKPDEILIPQLGGGLMIDGIRVIQPSNGYLDFSTGSVAAPFYISKAFIQAKEESQSHEYLSNTKPYLLFISASKSSRVTSLGFGDGGIFSYDANDEFQPVMSPGSYDVIKTALEKLGINSLEKLNEYIQLKRM